MNDIVCVEDFENHACKVLPKYAFDYYKGGALSESSLKLNRSAFSNLRLCPKVLRDVTVRNLSVTIMGQQLAMPIGIAPTALQKLAHPIGEGATVRAAQEKNVIFILSMYSTTSIEEISEIAPSAIKWFQMCVYKNREVNRHLIQRAEKAGFKAIVLTADTPVVGLRYSEARNKFSLPSHLKFENLEGLRKFESENGLSLSDLEYVPNNLNASFTWDDLKWFQSITKLPIILKGILTAEDAVTAADKGVAAIIVSNHGARQLDGVPATIEALPGIVKAVGERIDVFVDGGFRNGVDVFKALALGAKMVFVGRPILWGLSYDGQKGVKKVLDVLENELDNTFALTGCTSVRNISPDMVVHKNYYCRL